VVADFASEVLEVLVERGIDVSRIARASPDEPTSLLAPGPEQLASLSQTWSVHVCGMRPSLQRSLLTAAQHRAAVTTLDVDVSGPQPPDEEEVMAVATECDAFLPGRGDISRLWPGRPPREVLRLLLRRGVRAAVVKLGVGGSIGMREGNIVWVPAYPVSRGGRMTGGDAYAGAFSAVYTLERDLLWAMVWAAAAASVMVESAAPIEALTEFGRNRVAYRARLLHDDLRRG
jgi:sugar/nucleoside kinase (ribokinase family)